MMIIDGLGGLEGFIKERIKELSKGSCKIILRDGWFFDELAGEIKPGSPQHSKSPASPIIGIYEKEHYDRKFHVLISGRGVEIPYSAVSFIHSIDRPPIPHSHDPDAVYL